MKQLALVVVLACGATPASAGGKPYEDESCLGCHQDSGMEISLENGESQALFVDEQSFAGSVHGAKLKCSDCHPDEVNDPHPSKTFKDKRQIALVYSDKCKKCHFKNYTQTLDGVHQALQAKGNTQAALCVDCHGAHDIARPGEPRSKISSTCAKCHKGVYDVYATSVHGRALIEAENRDVPVCTDCHKAHDIKDPRQRDWMLATPALCGTCHTNDKLMSKYNLSSKVVSTYLADFHGTATNLQKASSGNQKMLAAVCSDCHGVHDIKTTRGEGAAAMKANLVNVCKKCHPDATASFPAAWMSHYEPSLQKTPIVYAVKLFYMFMIPFTIGGLILQILLHLWRVVVNR
jgi:Cytochrome c3